MARRTDTEIIIDELFERPGPTLLKLAAAAVFTVALFVVVYFGAKNWLNSISHPQVAANSMWQTRK